jgi:translocation and assembly module TamA
MREGRSTAPEECVLRVRAKGIWVAALAGTAFVPGVAFAQIAPGGQPGQSAPAPDTKPPIDAEDEVIVPDAEFEAAMPAVDGDIDAPLVPMPADTTAKAVEAQIEALDPIAEDEPEFAAPLPPIAAFDVTPLPADVKDEDEKTVNIRYTTVVEGLDKVGLDDRFGDLSALEKGDGKAANAAMVAARAREDERLALRLMQSLGYYDATALSTIEQNPANSGNLKAVISASPGAVYRLGKINIEGGETVPAGLLQKELPLVTGDPIEADRVQGAEANLSLKLPQQGYPFITLGQRDIVLDDVTHTGDYTLPVTLGPRASFGDFTTTVAASAATNTPNPRRRRARSGRRQVFDIDHIKVLARFEKGELYDSRKIDDLREALIATSLFSSVSVEPVQTGEPGPDGTEFVNLLVRQQAGRPRTIAGTLGYSTGEGLRLEASWTHRNLFPPEGALILSGVAGTQEQSANATFRRSNAGKRDRTVQVTVAAAHKDYEAYTAYTGIISGRISRDSTPIWQKRWTWYYGAEIVGSNEDRYNFATGTRDRGTWLIGAVPLFLGFDTSDNLLNPTRGFRIKGNVSPEASVRSGVRPYARLMVEGTAYQPVTDAIVVAGRARFGSIPGIARDDLPPSRRYYAGGGGSVRGFGYQELGPRSPDGKPVGGRGLAEFAIEARYRFGDYGIVPFIDAGQVSDSIYPKFDDIRVGVGVGARFYTNFGPLRIDVATPLNRRPGESKVALYISIGQAF